MESQHQKWVNVSYLVLAILVGYIVYSLSGKVVANFDLEARLKNIDLILRGFSFVTGGGLFFALYRNDQVNQFMNEVIVELSRVTWPTPKDTRSATVVVILMVLVSGMVLGLLDYVWTQAAKWVL